VQHSATKMAAMSLMQDFYGLQEHPFGVSADPRFLYPSIQHRQALNSLILGIEEQAGLSALIAEPGTGKTMLLFDIVLQYREQASIAFVFNTQCSGRELLRHIAMGLQIPGGESEHDPVRLHQLFTSFVSDPARTKPVVIIIDEAQDLESSALETLRLLSNFEAADHKPIHIIIAGQPLLEKNLRIHTQLLQRITIISRLQRLTPMQVAEYIEYRLQVAGYSGSALFTSEAIATIGLASRGVPREINRICINAIKLGSSRRQKQIGVDIIDAVLSELSLSGDPEIAASKGMHGAELQSFGFRPGDSNHRVESGATGIPAAAKGSEMSEPWTTEPVDLSLGDEVIDAVLAGMDRSGSSGIAVSDERNGPLFETVPKSEREPNASGKPRVSYISADLGLGDEVIESFLAGMNVSESPRTGASRGLAGAEQQSAGIDPKFASIPVESKTSKTSCDPRVNKIFAPRVSKVAAVPTTAEPKVSPPPEMPAVFNVPEETWVTNIPIEQWAQGVLRPVESNVAPSPEIKEPPPKPRESEPQKVGFGISSKALILLCAVFLIALLLFTFVALLSVR
jgi:general secretion pathway protein A